jgi:hypothetical protein
LAALCVKLVALIGNRAPLGGCWSRDYLVLKGARDQRSRGLLYADERTSSGCSGMSVLCHQRKSALASGSSFPWSTHVRQQLKKLLVGRALRGALDLPVTCDERKAERREVAPPPFLPPACRSTAARPQI